MQPTGTSGTSATWTGKVVALDSGGRVADNHGVPNFLIRGQLVGGDAQVTVSFSGSASSASVSLTNLKGTNVGGSTYSNRTWGSLPISSGSFSTTVTGPFSPGPISGTFRGTGATKVGATFKVPANSFGKDGLVGGFVADKD